MRDGQGPVAEDNLCLRLQQLHLPGHLREGWTGSWNQMDKTLRSTLKKTEESQAGIANPEVRPTFFTPSEEFNNFGAAGRPKKTVWAVGVVGVARTVNSAKPKN